MAVTTSWNLPIWLPTFVVRREDTAHTQALGRYAWLSALGSKLLGQVELMRQAAKQVRTGGSFTLITGRELLVRVTSATDRVTVAGKSVSAPLPAGLRPRMHPIPP